MGVRIIRWRNVGIILGVIIAIAAITVCVLPLVTVPYVVDVSYEDTETYYVEEPYYRTEIYTERELYKKSVPIDYRVIDRRIYDWFWSAGSDVSTGCARKFSLPAAKAAALAKVILKMIVGTDCRVLLSMLRYTHKVVMKI